VLIGAGALLYLGLTQSELVGADVLWATLMLAGLLGAALRPYWRARLRVRGARSDRKRPR
jgi:hypothetical protein